LTWYFKFPRGRMPSRRRGCFQGNSYRRPFIGVPSFRNAPASVIIEAARTRTNILLRLPYASDVKWRAIVLVWRRTI